MGARARARVKVPARLLLRAQAGAVRLDKLQSELSVFWAAFAAAEGHRTTRRRFTRLTDATRLEEELTEGAEAAGRVGLGEDGRT